MAQEPDDSPQATRLLRYPLFDDIRLSAYARHYGVTMSDLLRLAVTNLLTTLDATRPVDPERGERHAQEGRKQPRPLKRG